MRTAIEHGQISPEQYSRPKHSAAAHGINRILVFGYKQYLQQPLSLACNDLKSCYYMVVHSTDSLALQHLDITLP